MKSWEVKWLVQGHIDVGQWLQFRPLEFSFVTPLSLLPEQCMLEYWPCTSCLLTWNWIIGNKKSLCCSINLTSVQPRQLTTAYVSKNLWQIAVNFTLDWWTREVWEPQARISWSLVPNSERPYVNLWTLTTCHLVSITCHWLLNQCHHWNCDKA